MYIEERLDEMEEMIESLQTEIKRLQERSGYEIMTPKEFAQKTKLNENTVYCWIREGRIKILPNLGTALRIPMSQFYEQQEESATTKMGCKESRIKQLKKEFLASINESA